MFVLVAITGALGAPELAWAGAAKATTNTGNTNTANTVNTTNTVNTGGRARAAASSRRMKPVAAGTYPVGSDTPSAEAASARKTTVAAFFIDEFEVTNNEYRRFVDAVGAPPPSTWSRGSVPEGKGDHPVEGVTFDWAATFCSALDKRLPTDAEWEVAARGSDGRLYPWGADATKVDLDTPGSRPVGSVADNVSPFGVHDTVGSAWEWVDHPYEAIPAASRVRRGGEYGRVRQGAAMRQVVAPTNEAVVAETGFRCAADAVDAAAPPLRFRVVHPPASATPQPTTPPSTVAGGALIDDSFENPRSGWPARKEESFFVGYHAPTWFHIDASRPHVQAIALAGVQYGDVRIEASAYLDKIGDPTGLFRYGVVFRAAGPQQSPEAGVSGTPRPESFYAFVVDPRSNRWYLLHDDTLPFRTKAEGALPSPLRVTDSGRPDTFAVEASGRNIRMWVNGTEVGRFDTRNYHLVGDVGLYCETLDQTRAHAHFDTFTVKALPARG